MTSLASPDSSPRIDTTDVEPDGDVQLLGSWSRTPDSPSPAKGEESAKSRRTLRSRLPSRPGKLRPPVVVGLLILTALGFMLLDLRSGPTEQLRAVGLAVGGPAQDWADTTIGPVLTTPLQRPDAAALEARIDELEAKNAELRVAQSQALDALGAAAAAQTERENGTELGLRITPARVVAVNRPNAVGNSVTIDQGSQAGLDTDMAVLAQGALVGRIVQVSPQSSVVRLITDPLSQVFAAQTESRTTGAVTGTGRSLQVRFVDQFAKLPSGSELVTVGSQGGLPYPAGLPIARITSVPTDTTTPNQSYGAEPIAEVGSLDVVGVVTGVGNP